MLIKNLLYVHFKESVDYLYEIFFILYLKNTKLSFHCVTE